MPRRQGIYCRAGKGLGASLLATSLRFVQFSLPCLHGLPRRHVLVMLNVLILVLIFVYHSQQCTAAPACNAAPAKAPSFHGCWLLPRRHGHNHLLFLAFYSYIVVPAEDSLPRRRGIYCRAGKCLGTLLLATSLFFLFHFRCRACMDCRAGMCLSRLMS